MRLPTPVTVVLGARVGAWAVAGLTLAVVIPRRNPILSERGWARDPFPTASLTEHVALLGDRWDARWYAHVAANGYDETLRSAAFFPLYPGLVAALSAVGIPLWIAGTLLSLAALVVAALLVERIAAELGLPQDASTWALALLSFFPAAVVLGSMYPESLLVALFAGAWLLALRGRVRWCGVVCGAALLAKPLGVAALPLLLLQRPRVAVANLVRRRIEGLALASLIAALWPAWLWYRFGDPLRFVEAQSQWERSGTGVPLVAGAWNGLVAGGEGLARIIQQPLDLSRASISNLGDPVGIAMQNLVALAAILLLLGGAALTWRRIGVAPALLVLACALVPLSAPSADIPLLSAPRFALVALPAFVAAGAGLATSRWRVPVLAASAASFGLATAAWTAWQWIG